MNFDVKIRYDFIKARKWFFGFSVLMVLAGAIALAVQGLNLGVDFSAGTSVDITVGERIDKTQAEELLAKAGYPDQKVTVGGDRVSTRFDHELTPEEIGALEAVFRERFGDQVSSEAYTVSPDIAREVGMKAIYGVLIAGIGIALYVSIRFEWRFALASVLTILYDAVFVVALFAVFRLEVDLPFLAAVLTVVGYSINDKIVVFDRIRENLKFAKVKTKEDLALVINSSIWQTMARNINTVLTVLFAAVCLFIFGSESIKLFSLAMIFGLLSGAFSSICIASPLYYVIRNRWTGSVKKTASAKEYPVGRESLSAALVVHWA